MKSTTSICQIAVAAVFFILAAAISYPGMASASSGSKTLANLQAAFNGESNASAKYMAYAGKADEEGYHRVAVLFRAASKAEAIHAANHARVIRSLGAEPEAQVKLPEIQSTRENLEDALKGETYEQDVMYPEFLKQAALDKNDDADETFTYAREAEMEHAKLYRMALDDLEAWKIAGAEFSVCPICGFTVEGKPSFTDCPVCGASEEQYISIS